MNSVASERWGGCRQRQYVFGWRLSSHLGSGANKAVARVALEVSAEVGEPVLSRLVGSRRAAALTRRVRSSPTRTPTSPPSAHCRPAWVFGG
jgi:hypothetical protein